MKQDIRYLFEKDDFPKKELPDFHRDEFLEKITVFNQQNKKKTRIGFPLKIAASLLFLFSTGYYFLNKKTNLKAVEIVKIASKPLDLSSFSKKINLNENELVMSVNFKTFTSIRERLPFKEVLKNKQQQISIPIEKYTDNQENVVVKNTVDSIDYKKSIKNSIQIDHKALLFSMNHSSDEIYTYYKKNNIARDVVLANIETELKEMELQIDAENLLSEIEFGVQKNGFKVKIQKLIKQKLKELTIAFVSNK
tara:strand:+ start:198 stop:950 length:753 start_codon:yes stop_codon:yes gene_type:complete